MTAPASPQSPHLTGRMLDLLRGGEIPGREYPSRSEVLAALLLAMVTAGYTAGHAHAELTDPRNRGGAKVQKPRLNRSCLPMTLTRFLTEWHRAEERVGARPALTDRPATMAFMAEVEQSALAHPGLWTGITGATDRAVLAALCHVAEQAVSVEVSASTRQLAELAQCSKTAVMKSLHRLLDGPFLTRRTPHRGVLAPIYQLHCPDAEADPPDAVTVPRSSRGVLGKVADAFDRRSGIGLGPAKTLSACSAVEATPIRDLAHIAGAHRSTIARHIIRLARLGLVTVEDGMVLRTDVDPADLVFPPARRRRERRHDRQRDRFVRYRCRKALQRLRSLATLPRWPITVAFSDRSGALHRVDPVTGRTDVPIRELRRIQSDFLANSAVVA